ncbi:hypothetical protein N8987_01950 [Crocinitomix sp.]|nr:hypothetical protein [Crocinitomix sp.]
MKYLSKSFLYGILVFTIFSCGPEKRQNFTTLDDDGKIIISNESIAILEKIQADYDHCKRSETDEMECNQFTAKALCRFYEIEDFKKKDVFVSYREIKDVVTLNGGAWKAIGIATNQEDLIAAQLNANDTKATIAFDPTKSNHVAIILPGEMSKSGAWGLEVPNSASFFVHKPESYINKGLSYSFSSPEGIILYSKK